MDGDGHLREVENQRVKSVHQAERKAQVLKTRHRPCLGLGRNGQQPQYEGQKEIRSFLHDHLGAVRGKPSEGPGIQQQKNHRKRHGQGFRHQGQ